MNLAIENVFNVSVSQPGAQIGEYNTSNFAIISHEPAQNFGSDDYKLYLEPTEVGKDFGTDSITYKMAVSVFSQAPNILGPGGYLVIFKAVTAAQSISFPSAPVSGVFKLNFGGVPSANINWNDSASQIETKVRAIPGLEKAIIGGNIPAGLTVSTGRFGPQALLTVSANTMVNAGAVAVNPVVASVTPGEDTTEAILRTADEVEYFGVAVTRSFTQDDETEVMDAAESVQPINKLFFVVSNDPDVVEPDGLFDAIKDAGLNHTRCLFYGLSEVDALRMAAAYASRGLSVDFDGNNTTITMHLKDLIGIGPDSTMTQTLLNKCVAAGADVYASIGGVAKTFTSGENTFFDRVYNLMWFIGDVKVAGFNLYASTPTKIPQTEDGQLQLISTVRSVAEQAITNQFLAPGEWNSPVTFGNQADLIANVRQRGYYIYSAPISKQSAADRLARKAPLVQIAIKEAGAEHSASLIINVNA